MRRGALLMPVAALAVHQLRYLLAFGGDAGPELAEQGHAYLHSATPWLVLACAAAFGGALGRAAWGTDDARPSLARTWLLATTGLIAVYAGQELLEGLLASGHPGGLAGVFGAGGWLAIPSAVLVAAALTLALQGARAALARLRPRHRPPVVRAPAAPRPRAHHPSAPSPLATAAAGRAPPRSRMDPHRQSVTKGTTMNRRTIALGAAASLALPATAAAHVTVHPNVIPEGAFAVLNVRVPNETDDADTTKVQVQMPDGFAFASAEPPPGWKVSFKKSKLATPIETDDGAIDEQVSEITFSGGKIPPGQFVQFPLSVGVPGKSGDTLTFKALQTYSNGDVVRWIGEPDADQPAPTITIADEGGLIEDSTGEHGASHDDDEADEAAAPAAAPATKVVREESGNGLSIAALVVGGLGLLAGGAALAASRRSR